MKMSRILLCIVSATLLLTFVNAQEAEKESASEFEPASEVESPASEEIQATLPGDPSLGVPSREAFRSLVIANLPRVLSVQLEGLAQRLSDRSGVKLDPQWWQLDMAAFRSEEPFNGAELAESLGLNIVADVSDDLILSPLDVSDPRSRQAEARVFLRRLFKEKNRLMWDGFGEGNQQIVNPYGVSVDIPFRAMGNFEGFEKVRSNNVNRTQGQPGVSLKESDVFSRSGPLEDEKVYRALGLRKEDLNIPLRNYKLSDFQVESGPPSQGNSYSWQYQSQDNRQVRILAKSGAPRADVPSGPDAMPELNINFMYWWWMFSEEFYPYNSYYQQSSEQEVKDTDPSFVCLQLDTFQRDFRPDATKAREYAESMKALGEVVLEDVEGNASKLEELRGVFEESMLYGRRTFRTSSFAWADPSAISILKKDETGGAVVRAEKRKMAELAKSVLRKYANRMGASAKFSGGGAWDMYQFYGYQYSAFESSIYQYNELEFRNPVKEGMTTSIEFGTRDNVSQPKSFCILIFPSTGESEWKSGEPESEELVFQRKTEVFQGVNAIVNHLNSSEEFPKEFTSDWIRGVFAQANLQMKYAAEVDFTVRVLLPDIYQVEGSLSRESRQAAFVDKVSSKVEWETKAPEATKDVTTESEYPLIR